MILFAGPSLSNTSREIISETQVELRPPAQRRDIAKLVAEGYEGAIAIVDGVFNQSAAVGHAEIRQALTQGHRIYGLSSMGAIRAWEMRNLGMIGYGEVYSYFSKMDDFQDDEMALLHGPGPQYINFSEPMIHFRYCIEQLQQTDQLDAAVARNLTTYMKERYFGERTMDLFKDALEHAGHPDPASVIDSFDMYRIKINDLITFLDKRVWEKTDAI